MNSSSDSSGRDISSIASEILVDIPSRINSNTITDEQLALIEETLDLVMLSKFEHSLDDEILLKSDSSTLPSRKSTNTQDTSSVSEEKQESLILGVTEVQEKICRCLFDIQSHIQSDVAFEDDEEIDVHRRRRRFEEFSTRLSRNYMYQISCSIGEIESTNRKKLLQKTSQLFTGIFHALRFYCQNMVNFTNEMQIRKLLEMIKILLNGLHVCVKKKIFAKEDELVGRIREMLQEIYSECDEFCKAAQPRLQKPKSAKKTTSGGRNVPKNSLAMYLPQQQSPKKTTTPKFHLNLEGSDDEAPEGISRELSAEHLDTVTTEDRLKLMEEQPQPTTSNSRPRTHPSVSILEPNRDDFRHKSRELHRKDRASSHASSSMKVPEAKDKTVKMNFGGQKRIPHAKKRSQRSSLDSAYSEIGKEIVDIVGEHSIKSILLLKISSRQEENFGAKLDGRKF